MPGNAGDTETQDWINNSFAVARQLHTNFYEARSPEDEVRAGLRQCERLSELLYALSCPEGLGDDGG